jgi:hypothetical protein
MVDDRDEIKKNAARIIGITAEAFQVSGGLIFYIRLLTRFRLVKYPPLVVRGSRHMSRDTECRHSA